jgi:hypothetical protein
MVVACADLRPRFSGFDKLPEGQTAVVGKVELVPPLADADQQVDRPGASDLEDRVFVVVDDHVRIVSDAPGLSQISGSIKAPLGMTFRAVLPTKPHYLLKSIVFLKVGRVNDSATFPGTFAIDIQPGDRAVYLGTLRYHRNEFMETVRVEVIDDYEREAAEFAKAYGTTPRLENRLLRLVEAAPSE